MGYEIERRLQAMTDEQKLELLKLLAYGGITAAREYAEETENNNSSADEQQ